MNLKVEHVEPLINGLIAYFALKIATDFISLFFPYMNKLNIVYNLIIISLLIGFRKKIINWFNKGVPNMPHDKYTSCVCAKCYDGVIVKKHGVFICNKCFKEALIENKGD